MDQNPDRIKRASMRIYEPDAALKRGYGSLLADILREVQQNRWLLYQLFRRDFVVSYKQSFLGLLWAFVVPLMSVGLFIGLSSAGILSVGRISYPYLIYALVGVTFWQVLSIGLLACANSLVQAGSLIAKINVSKKSIVIASTGQIAIPLAVNSFLVIVCFFYYGFVPSALVVILPLLLLPIGLVTLGVGLITSLLNGITRDVGSSLPIGLTFLMVMTPILYAPPEVGVLHHITVYNPIYYLVAVPRDLVLSGRSSELFGFFISSFLSLTVFVICLTVFHFSETRVAERI